MPETRASELKALRAELEQLKALMTVGNSSNFCIPDPIKNFPYFSGNKKELSSWLRELDELYDMFKIKGANVQPDSISSVYLRAIKIKLKDMLALFYAQTEIQIQSMLSNKFPLNIMETTGISRPMCRYYSTYGVATKATSDCTMTARTPIQE